MIADRFELLRAKHTSIELMPTPFWIKELVDGKFVMRYINKAYGKAYCIPNGLDPGEYPGKTDYEYWPSDIARIYEKNDIDTLTRKGSYIFDEKVMDGTNRLIRTFIKMYVKDQYTGKVFIAGMTIEKDDTN